MIKKRSIELGRVSFTLILSAIFLLIYNYPTILQKFEIGDLILHFQIIASFLALFNFIIKPIAIFLAILSTIYLYILNNFGIIIDESMIANGIDNLSETPTIIGFNLILYVTSFVIFVYLITIVKIRKGYLSIISLLLPLIAIIAFTYWIKNDQIKPILSRYSPANYIGAIFQYGKMLITMKKNSAKINIDSKYKFEYANSNTKGELNLVLIIGESARSQNFSLAGYGRNTNPELSKIKNLLFFGNLTPCSNATRISISCMLSSKTSKEFFIPDDEKSIISLYKKLGFKTYFYSAQSAYGGQNIILQIAMEADKFLFRSFLQSNLESDKILDGDLLPYIDNIINDSNNTKNQFIIIHTNGSHFIFDDRYSEKYRKFTPTCGKNNPRECVENSLVNSYDNSILYTDYFISEVIKKFRDTKSVIFYISDHGQFLGENGVYYHGNSDSIKSHEHRIPMILWMSDLALSDKTLKTNFKNAAKKTGKNLSHDNLFDSLLGCVNVKSEILSRNLNICQ